MTEPSRFEGTKSYIATNDLKVAVNAAVTLRRPLLVKGEPGTGKTVLAHEISKALDAPLIEWNVKSTTKAQQGLYEYEPVFGVAPHQLVDQFLHHRALFELLPQGDPDQAARVRVHRGFAQLRGIHFAQALEAADINLLALEHRGFEFGAVCVVAGVAALLARGQPIERGLGDRKSVV